MDRLRLALPSLGREELVEIERVLASGYLTQGPVTAEFEQLVAAEVGVRHAFAMSSATTALHLSLVVLGVGPGDDVVVPAFTFPATANVVVQLGARPVFADVDLATFAVNADTLDAAATERTVAVMPVDPFGFPAPMQEIAQWAAPRGIRVVEDAACALGASRHGVPCGAFPDVGCFSFHPRKVITTGEGGMITTNDDELAAQIGLLRSHGGRRVEGRFSYEAAGFNYRLSDIQGAIGVAQMRKLKGILEQRRQLAVRLTGLLRAVPGVRPPVSMDGVLETFQSYVVLVGGGIDRDGLITRLAGHGIESTVGTYGLHLEPFFRDTYGLAPGMFPAATEAARRSLTLPLHPGMEDADLDRVAGALAAEVG